MQKDSMLRVEVLPGGACIEPLPGPDSSFISGRCNELVCLSINKCPGIYNMALLNVVPTSTVSGHPVLLLPVTKTEPESLSSDETDVSDSHFEGVSAA